MDSNSIYNNDKYNDGKSLKEEIIRYSTFWPYFLLSIVIVSASAYLYLRYAEYQYESFATIEIIDKSQDSEMSLPTAMTVFNRSMINLENEIGVLGSYSLHQKVVKKLDANVQFYTKGRIKVSENHRMNWYKDYELNFNVNFDTINRPLKYILSVNDTGGLKINFLNHEDELLKSYSFKKLSTFGTVHNLPFDISINSESIFFLKLVLEFSVSIIILSRSSISFNIIFTFSFNLSFIFL